MNLFIFQNGSIGPPFSIAIQWWGYFKWQLKFFSHYPMMGVCWMVIEILFWGLSKNIWHAPILWWLISFGCHNEWQQKIFDCQKWNVISFLKQNYPPLPSWATKKFQSPSNGGGVLDGDRKILVVIWHTIVSIGDQFFSITPKKGMSYVFMETFRYKEGCLKKIGLM
jgi:hypothetical protein